MQHDEVIWQVIRHNHCSFMTKISTGNFCRNPYNLTGICNRSSCPLANSRYATIRDHDDVLAKISCTQNQTKIDKNESDGDTNEEACIKDKGMYSNILSPITYTIKSDKLCSTLEECVEKIVSMPRKETKRESRREEKAEMAAALTEKIETELLDRLKKGIYGPIYNFHKGTYERFLDQEKSKEVDQEEEEEYGKEYVEADDELEEEDDIEDFGGLAIANDDDHSDDDSDEDEEAVAADQKKGRRSIHRKREKDDTNSNFKKKAKVLVEVEHEDTGERPMAVQ